MFTAAIAWTLEARQRGNSVYLPGTVIPMLPEALSNGLCSLRPDEDRACLAVEILIDDEGKKISHNFFQALIRSSARLTYTTVQQVIDGGIDEADCAVKPGTIHHLVGAYRTLHAARLKRGTLNLDLSEARIQFDETGEPVSVAQHYQKEAHQLIEEFMILANICAAETLEQARQNCVYRIHDRPDPEKIDSLKELTEALSLPFAKGQVITPHRFNELLAKVKDTDAETAVNEAVLRCQARAVYAPDNIGQLWSGAGQICSFHLSHSPICRSAGPSRFGPGYGRNQQTVQRGRSGPVDADMHRHQPDRTDRRQSRAAHNRPSCCTDSEPEKHQRD